MPKKRSKRVEEKDPLLDATHPHLRNTLIIPENQKETIKMFTGELREMNQDLMQRSLKHEITVFMSWEDFAETCSAIQIVEIAKKFKCTTKKGLNKLELSIIVWRSLCEIAVPIGSARGVDSKAPKKTGKLANRKYVKVKDNELTEAELATRHRDELCPQAQVCLDIFLEEGMDEVSESRMMETITEKQERLRTRQDPWRIWQYYRPALIRERWIRLV